MGTLQFSTISVNKYLLSKHTKGTRKNPLKTGKIPKYNIITSKKFGKTLGKRLLPESNRSWRRTPGGQIF